MDPKRISVLVKVVIQHPTNDSQLEIFDVQKILQYNARRKTLSFKHILIGCEYLLKATCGDITRCYRSFAKL